ncbi:hypothetical protein V8C37DRAFT_418258 [Trichoderma ceciliae]
MRGLGKAATLILAPTAVLARPLSMNPTPSRGPPVDSAFAVAIAVDTSGSRDAKTVDQTLVFNLDIQESSEACSQAKVRIDGYLLSQDDNGTGQGTFASLDGHTVTASWNFTCKEHVRRVPWDQDLTVAIMSLDGEAVPEATFFASFRQRTPVKVYDVGGDSVVYTTEGHAPSRLDEDRLLDRIKAITGLSKVDDEIKTEIKEIISMEHQIHELRDLVKAKQRRVLDGLGIKRSAPAFNLQTFYQTAKLASSTLRGTMEQWLNSVLGFPLDRKYHGYRHRRFPYHHPHHREDGLVVSMQVDGKGGQRFFYYRESDTTQMTPIHSRRHVTYLPLFATILTFHLALFFVLRSIRQRSHSRRARNPSIHTSRQQCRRETRARRRVQRQAPRAGFKQTIDNFLCNVRDLFQAKRIELNEKTSMSIHEEDTSMEDELASFQEAASMVSDMVAAEERRTSRRDETQPPRFTQDVSPPAYDEEKRPDGC